MKEFKTIDLCAGIGGIRRGFEMTGHFRNVLAAENDSYAAKTYKHLFGDDPTNDLTSDDFLNKIIETDYDVLLAGFPCQAFSSVGKKLGFLDQTRGTIFFHIAKIISETKPKAIFLENVQNIISHDNGNTIRTIVETLEKELGYKIIGVTENEDGSFSFSPKTLIRNTRFFGLPQNRPRAYFMAFRKSYFGPAILRVENKELPKKGKEKIYSSVRAVLEKSVDDKYYMSSGYLNTLKEHKARQQQKGNGFGYCVVNQKGRKSRLANTILATGGSGKERNLVFQPKKGISEKPMQGKKTPLNSEGIRVMTPSEWGRLQGFIGYAFLDAKGNDCFSFPDGLLDGQKYKQLGNSVSIPVIKAMALFMFDCIMEMLNCNERKVVDLIEKKGFVTRKDIMNSLDLSYQQANYLLNKLCANKFISSKREGRLQEFYL